MKDFLSKVFDLKQHGSSQHHPTDANNGSSSSNNNTSNTKPSDGMSCQNTHQDVSGQTAADTEAIVADALLPSSLPSSPELAPATSTGATRASKFLQRTLRPLQKIQTLLRSPPLGPSTPRQQQPTTDASPLSPMAGLLPAPALNLVPRQPCPKGEASSSLTTVWSPTVILPDTPTAWSFAGSLSQMGSAAQGSSSSSASAASATSAAVAVAESLPSFASDGADSKSTAVQASFTPNAYSAELMDTLMFTQLLTSSMAAMSSQSSSSTNDPSSSTAPTTTTTAATTRTTRRTTLLQKEKEQKLMTPAASSLDRFNKPLPNLPPSTSTTTRAKASAATKSLSSSSSSSAASSSTQKPKPPPSRASAAASASPLPLMPAPTPNAAAIYFPPSMSALHQKRRKLKRHAQRVPRPKNCFMFYRSKILPAIMAEWGGLVNNRILSTIAAERWRSDESDEVRRYYQLLARQGNEEHRRIHPDYKYAAAAAAAAATAAAPSSSAGHGGRSTTNGKGGKSKEGRAWEEDGDDEEDDEEEDDEEDDGDRDNDVAMDYERVEAKKHTRSSYDGDDMDSEDEDDDDDDDDDMYVPSNGTASSRRSTRRVAFAQRLATDACRRLLQGSSRQGSPATTVDKVRSRRRGGAASGSTALTLSRPKTRLGGSGRTAAHQRRSTTTTTTTSTKHPFNTSAAGLSSSVMTMATSTPSLLVTTPVSPSVLARFTSTADGDYFGGVPLIAPLSALGLHSSSSPSPSFTNISAAAAAAPFHYLPSLSPAGQLGALAFDNSSAVTLVDDPQQANNMLQAWPTIVAAPPPETSFAGGRNGGGGGGVFKHPTEDGQGDITMLDTTTTTTTTSSSTAGAAAATTTTTATAASKSMAPMAPMASFPKLLSMPDGTGYGYYSGGGVGGGHSNNIHHDHKKLLLATADPRWLQTLPPAVAAAQADPLQVLQSMYQLYNTGGGLQVPPTSSPYLAFPGNALMQQPPPPLPPSLPLMCLDPTLPWLNKSIGGAFQQGQQFLPFQQHQQHLHQQHQQQQQQQQHNPMNAAFFPTNLLKPTGSGLATLNDNSNNNNNNNAFDSFFDFVLQTPTSASFPSSASSSYPLQENNASTLFEPPPATTPAMPAFLQEQHPPPMEPFSSSSSSSSSSSLQRRGSVASTWTTLSTLSSLSSLSSSSSSSASPSSISTDRSAFLIPPPSTTEPLFQSFASIGQQPSSSPSSSPPSPSPPSS
ncbi:hypothetical protein DFQ27_000670 [Actinomortierella ambigua]|uniref:HMG box domain-containing protein n=1 Tax=Actinomortierella ambigua TaxID=1343610 RepID=A0A9P6QFF1_9FUNG|nr:hypothetical protein DFQ27_000670 [Actinomortierella ambigua]